MNGKLHLSKAPEFKVAPGFIRVELAPETYHWLTRKGMLIEGGSPEIIAQIILAEAHRQDLRRNYDERMSETVDAEVVESKPE